MKNTAGFTLFPLFCLISTYLPFIKLVFFKFVRKHSTSRKGNTNNRLPSFLSLHLLSRFKMELMSHTWPTECLALTAIFKYSFLILKVVINIKIRVSDCWKTGGSGNTGAKIFRGKHQLELSDGALRFAQSLPAPDSLESVTLPYF